MARFVIFAFFASLMVAQVAHATVDSVAYLNATGFATSDLTAPFKKDVLDAAKAIAAEVKSIEYSDMGSSAVELAVTFTGADDAASKQLVTDFNTKCTTATAADLPNAIIAKLGEKLTGKTVAKVDCVRKASTTTTTSKGNSKATAISMIVIAAVGLLQL